MPYDLYRDLGARPAQVRSRALAAAVDAGLLLIVGCAAFVAFGLLLLQGEPFQPGDADGMGPVTGSHGVDPGSVALLVLPVLLVWLWNRVIRVSQGGASVGMGWLGIRLVSVRTGTSPTADQAVLRALVGLLLLLPAGAGLLTIFTDRERRALHDRASGVVIIEPPE